MTSIIILAAAGIASMFVGVFKFKRIALPLVLLACIAALCIIFLKLNGGYELIDHGCIHHQQILFPGKHGTPGGYLFFVSFFDDRWNIARFFSKSGNVIYQYRDTFHSIICSCCE